VTSDYYTSEEMVQFKKLRKKKKARPTRTLEQMLLDDSAEAPEQDASALPLFELLPTYPCINRVYECIYLWLMQHGSRRLRDGTDEADQRLSELKSERYQRALDRVSFFSDAFIADKKCSRLYIVVHFPFHRPRRRLSNCVPLKHPPTLLSSWCLQMMGTVHLY
jgi:hypothetical protein